MTRLRYPKRQKLLAEQHRAAYDEAFHIPQDPGLRDVYEGIPRARIRLIACVLTKTVNQGGLVRLAEAFRIERVSIDAGERDVVDLSGAVGLKGWQPIEWADALESILRAKQEGYRTVGLTLNPRAVPLREFDWTFPCALVLGEERYGLLPDVESECDDCVGIPLYGLAGSINVGAAAALALESATDAYRRQFPDFQPVRNASRRLLGLPPAEYRPRTDIEGDANHPARPSDQGETR